MIKLKKKAFLSVNLAVLLFGLAGLFAKWIRLPALAITFGRVFFSSVALGLFLLLRKQSFRVGSRRDLLLLLCAGAILALHWWSFLASIQLATVAIGTITFSSFPLFVIFLEPLAFRRKLSLRNLVFALIILAGVIVTVPEFSFANRMFAGIAAGMLSAFSYAVLTVMNKGFSERVSGTLTAFYEQTAAALVLLPFILGAHAQPSAADLGLLLLLGVVMTAAAHTLFISSLKSLPAQLAGLCSSMETVYGIVFAFLLLGEVPGLREILGACLIVGTVIAAQLSEGRTSKA